MNNTQLFSLTPQYNTLPTIFAMKFIIFPFNKNFHSFNTLYFFSNLLLFPCAFNYVYITVKKKSTLREKGKKIYALDDSDTVLWETFQHYIKWSRMEINLIWRKSIMHLMCCKIIYNSQLDNVFLYLISRYQVYVFFFFFFFCVWCYFVWWYFIEMSTYMQCNTTLVW